jgi:hypothetical protein
VSASCFYAVYRRFTPALLHGCCTPWQRQKTSARIKEGEVCSFDILAGMKRR